MPPKSSGPRLLVILNVFHPDRGGGAAVFSDLCYSLARRGFDVTVRCAYPYYPEWRDKSGRNGWRIEHFDDQGVHVERYGIFIPRDPQSLFQRILYEGSFLLSVLRSLPRGRDFDATMVYCPLVGSVAFAQINRWVHRKPLWLNVQDLSAHAAAASGISRFRRVNRFLESIQNRLFNSAQVWSSISPVMIDKLDRIRRRGQPIVFLPNWLNRSLETEIERLPPKVGRNPDSPVNLLYAGNIGDKQGLLNFCRILQQSSSQFRFKIHGNGSAALHVARWVKDINDTRFSFAPFLSEPEFARALHDTDLFVITEVANSVGAFIPSKMVPGMATATPILAICDADSPLGTEMTQSNAGYWFPWDRSHEVGGLLETLPYQYEDFAQRQQRALDRSRAYDRESVIKRFDVLLRAFARGEPIEDETEQVILPTSRQMS